ncbi:MAG TPA: hypothetical protein VHM91_04290 [Verrucomicrobiales bacterium]|jgi:hypothetical protein|nr:hypothetical protein [Verrucomicrobiales bacterium]
MKKAALVTTPQLVPGFEILLNGAKLCTAGIGEEGGLTVFVNCRECRVIDGAARDSMSLSVGGFISRTKQHLGWPGRDLRLDDEVIIRVVQTSAPDKPVKKRRMSAALERRGKENYVRKMAAELGWKIVEE